MKKKLIIVALIAAVVVLFSFPASLYAQTNTTYEITVVKTADGFDSDVFTFELYRYNGMVDDFVLVNTNTVICSGGSVILTWDDPYDYMFSERRFKVTESGTNGATGVAWSFSSGPSATDGTINDTTDEFTIQKSSPTGTVYFDNIKVVSNPDISITKIVDPTSAEVGETVTYTIAVENIGDVDLTNVTITDPMLGLNQNIGPLAQGVTHTLADIDYVIPDADPNPLVNTAVVTTDQQATDNDSASVGITEPEPEIIVEKTSNGFTTGEFIFKLQRFFYGGGWVDEQGDIPIPFGGGSNSFTGLENGWYRVIEINTNGADGTTNSLSGPPTASVGDDNTTSNNITLGYCCESKTVYFDNIKETGCIKVIKKNPEGEYLEGAGFTVYFEDNTVAASELFTDATTGMVSFCGLALDTKYIVRETTNPPGYGYAPDQEVTLTGEVANVILTFVNEPESGDGDGDGDVPGDGDGDVPGDGDGDVTGDGDGDIAVLGIQELPFTGFSYVYYIIGFMLIAAGGIASVKISRLLKREKQK